MWALQRQMVEPGAKNNGGAAETIKNTLQPTGAVNYRVSK